MVFLLRRAASIAVPISACYISSSSTRSKTSIARHLSSSSSSDADLLKVLDSEIKFASQDCKQLEKLPKGFPFTIIDEKGTNVIFLNRSYRNERIEVLVSIPNLIPGEEPDDNDDSSSSSSSSSERNNDDEHGEFSIPLTVNISKGTGSSLELRCTAYPNEIVIDSLCLRRHKKDGDERMFAFGGHMSSNRLDKKLRNALHNFIEKRGISPITTNLLYEYMINKNNREYLLWLKNLRRFIKKW